MKHPVKFWLPPFAAVAVFLVVVVCIAADFNPFAWLWACVMELARAIGGHG